MTDPSAHAAATARSAGRKIREMKYALTLEQKYPDAKERILEGYLNIAAFGPSTYGVEASSRHYFSHSAKELTIPEAALLAGLTNAPGAYDPIAFPDKAKDRMNWVLDKMLEEEFINQDEWQAGHDTQIEDILNVTETVGGCGTAGSAAYFCEYVKAEIENSELFGATREERNKRLLRGGLTITTTLDMSKQAAADAAVQQYVPTADPSNVKAALSSVEPGTGRIVAMSQNTNYGVEVEGDSSTTQISLNATPPMADWRTTRAPPASSRARRSRPSSWRSGIRRATRDTSPSTPPRPPSAPPNGRSPAIPPRPIHGRSAMPMQVRVATTTSSRAPPCPLTWASPR